jgi:hypothetical protein
MFTAARNPKRRFRTAAGCSAKSETIFANSRDFLRRSDAPMHSEEHTDGGVLQLYEDFFGVEEAVGPPA